MAYICKNCGKIITDEEYRKAQKTKENAMGCGCFIWLLILLCCVSLILIPIAIILIGMVYDKQPDNECPYCNAKNSLIPDNTPIAKKLIEENYTETEIKDIEYQNELDAIKRKKEKEKMPIGCSVTLWIIAIWFITAIILGVTGYKPAP